MLFTVIVADLAPKLIGAKPIGIGRASPAPMVSGKHQYFRELGGSRRDAGYGERALAAVVEDEWLAGEGIDAGGVDTVDGTTP